MKVYVGIDVAFAKRKRLPICIALRNGDRLDFLSTRSAGLPAIPRGLGNRAAIEGKVVSDFALEVAAYLHEVERHFQCSIQRIAIDAPSAPRLDEAPRGKAELALDKEKISCFATPSEARFSEIRTSVENDLQEGGTESTLPSANQLWMLVGFALFRRLERVGVHRSLSAGHDAKAWGRRSS